MRGTRTTPIDNDEQGQQKTTKRIEPPDLGVEAHKREQDTEDVENDIGFGVLGECLHRRVPDETAPEPTTALDDDGRGHDGDGRNGKLNDGAIVASQPAESLDGDLEEGGDHDDAKHQHTDGLKTATTYGIGVLVLGTGDDPRRHPDYGGRQEVQGCVDQGGDDGERRGHDGDDDLEDEEDGVGDQVDVDGELDDGALGAFVLLWRPVGHALCCRVHGILLVVASWLQQRCVLVDRGHLVQILRGTLHLDLRGGAVGAVGGGGGGGGVVAVAERGVCLRGGGDGGGFLGDGGGDVDVARLEGAVLLDEVVGQRRVEQAVDVVVVLDQVVVALVVLAHAFILVLLELVFRLEVAVPPVARVGAADEALAAHLGGVQGGGADAGPALALRGQVLGQQAAPEVFHVIVAGHGAAAVPPRTEAAQGGGTARDQALQLAAARGQGIGVGGQREEAPGVCKAREAGGPWKAAARRRGGASRRHGRRQLQGGKGEGTVNGEW